MAGTASIQLKAVLPKKFNERAFRDAIESMAEAAANDIHGNFQTTVATWKHKVQFEKTVTFDPKQIRILVATDDEIYAYVVLGTKRHVIRPKRAKVLAFPSAFRAKTIPNKPFVVSIGMTGEKKVFAKEVNHPGTKARNFDKVIKKIWEKRLALRLKTAMQYAAKASGHAI